MIDYNREDFEYMAKNRMRMKEIILITDLSYDSIKGRLRRFNIKLRDYKPSKKEIYDYSSEFGCEKAASKFNLSLGTIFNYRIIYEPKRIRENNKTPECNNRLQENT